MVWQINIKDEFMQQFGSESIKTIFMNVAEFNLAKLLGAIGAFAYSYIFNDSSILIVIYTLICIDTLTGFWSACKRGEVRSGAFVRVAMKCFVYFLLIIVGRLVDKVTPVSFAATIMESFLAITEALSIMENIGKLGFPVPSKLVKILHIFSEKKHKRK